MNRVSPGGQRSQVVVPAIVCHYVLAHHWINRHRLHACLPDRLAAVGRHDTTADPRRTNRPCAIPCYVVCTIASSHATLSRTFLASRGPYCDGRLPYQQDHEGDDISDC